MKRSRASFDQGELTYRERRNLQFQVNNYYLAGSKAKPKPNPKTTTKRKNRGKNIHVVQNFKRNTPQQPHLIDEINNPHNQQNFQPHFQQIPHQPPEPPQNNNLNLILAAIPLVEEAAAQPPPPLVAQPAAPRPAVVTYPLEPGMAEIRRHAIAYQYVHVHRRPAPSEWVAQKIIPKICEELHIPEGSKGCVKTTLHKVVQSVVINNKPFNAKRTNNRRGFIIDQTPQAELVYNAQRTGLSVNDTTFIINAWRAAQDPPLRALSYSAVQSFIAYKSQIIVKARRTTKKSGKDDPNSQWARARLAQMRQFKEQLRLATLPANSPELLNPLYPPLHLDAIVFWDEKHHKVRLGHASKHEVRIRVDANGVPSPEREGGVLPPPMPTTSVKFPEEARGLFGACMIKETAADGTVTYRGVKAKPFQYTKRLVIGLKTFNAALQAELQRVKPLGGVWGAADNGYEHRFGANWEVKLRSKVNKKYCCITELMDHVIKQSNKIYANTPHANTYLIFHDALATWWEADAQAYLAQKGFAHRQLRCLGATNAGNRYKGKLTGDTPELCRALDSHGFADLTRSMRFHASLSSVYPMGDPRRFNMGTPAEVWRTMVRCWQMEPTSERIVQDIQKLPWIIDKIIEAEGCVVQDLALRHGRRGEEWGRASGEGYCSAKPRMRQRKVTLKEAPLHPDCVEARNIICNLPAGHPIQVAQLDDLLDSDIEGSDSEDELEDDDIVPQHIDAPDVDIFDD